MDKQVEKDAESAYKRIDLQNPLNPEWLLRIQQCFRKPDSLTIPQLQEWRERYLSAEMCGLGDEPALEELKSDELDEKAVENCLVDLAKEIAIVNGFCAHCQHLFDNYPDLGDPNEVDLVTDLHWPGSGLNNAHAVVHGYHTLVLEAAARNGCRFCSFLMGTIRDSEFLEALRKIEARMQYLKDKNMMSLSVKNWATFAYQFLWLEFPGKYLVYDMADFQPALLFQGSVLDESADTYNREINIFDTANAWITKCVENHKDCQPHHADITPTRLVHIADDAARIVLTEGWASKPRYSTLSHRWGNKDFLKLTRENYDAFLSRIPLKELPQTFRDAIHITKQLGIEYIWIDSLCIVQGDHEDWEREASLMSPVYGGSFINIAASSATSVYESCFMKTPYLVDSVRALITINNEKLVRQFLPHDIYDKNVKQSHLATRAWALQEKILPPRTMHFGERGVFWECRMEQANEFSPNGFSDCVIDGMVNDEHRRDFFTAWWSNVISMYSATELTYIEDKLPALSGIARRTHEEEGWQYLAGMWRNESFETQLCWQALDPQERSVYAGCAPSWSWASVNGTVDFNPRMLWLANEYHAHVLDAEMTYLGSNVFGGVSSGRLHIGCSDMLVAKISGEGKVRFDFSQEKLNVDTEYPVLQDCIGDEWVTGSTVYLLPIMGGKDGYRTDIEEGETQENVPLLGIILRPESGAKGHFHRVGIFRFYNTYKDGFNTVEEKERRLDLFQKVLDSKVASVVDSVCAETVENVKHPKERYVIYVI